MTESRLFQHPSSQPSGLGITIGTPRFYDLTAALLFAGTRRRSYWKLIEAAGVRSGDRVLDVGCGPGYLTRVLGEAVGPTGSVVGVDAAPEMIEYATRKARSVSNCRYESGTAESLSFPDASFDVVVSSLMMHHLPEEIRLQAVGEMKRVLRPAGTVLVADFTVPRRGAWRVVAHLTGHARNSEMVRRASRLEPLVAESGFRKIRSGDVPPWLRYVRAAKP